jgi:phage terminase small subunit
VSGKGFVSLKSLVGKAPSTPEQILEEIRAIYFNTTKQTIQNDVAHAIELLKRLPDEETREKATVYMHGLAEMRNQWARSARKVARKGAREVKGQRSKVKSKSRP